MQRVVITGMGIVSCLGNDIEAVNQSLQNGQSGIQFAEDYAELGMRSHIAGRINIDADALIDRRQKRFMGSAAAYAAIAFKEAQTMAGLSDEAIRNPQVGLVAGSGGGSASDQVEAADIFREKGLRRVGPYRVPRTMTSTVSACLATTYGIQGINYSITSACASSAHSIGHAYEQIQLGKQSVMFAGGGEEEHWTMSILFDAMGALSTKYNDTPTQASRPYDAHRDGFVIAGGGGILVLESLEHAQARGANILAEIVGYAATSDGVDMVAPSGEGAERCMKMAMQSLTQPVDYVNAHGTSTPAGDITELKAIERAFGGVDSMPLVGSTKSMSGHSLGAAGVQEAIYTLLMMRDGYIAPTINLNERDEQATHHPIVTETLRQPINVAMSNSFGFGGTNAALVFQRWNG